VRHRGRCDLRIRAKSLSLLSSSCLYLVNLLEPRRKNVSVVRLLACVHGLLRCHAKSPHSVFCGIKHPHVKELTRLDSDCLYLGETSTNMIYDSIFDMQNKKEFHFKTTGVEANFTSDSMPLSSLHTHARAKTTTDVDKTCTPNE
jgi:hypothetical protein